MKYRVCYYRENCVGDFACAALAPDFWTYGADDRADLAGARYNKREKRWELVIDEQDLLQNRLVVEECPSGAVMIEEVPDMEDEPSWASHEYPPFSFGVPH